MELSQKPPNDEASNQLARPGRRWQGVALALLGLLLAYLAIAYVVMPRIWKAYESRHPELANIPRVTHTGSDIPADPLNVALIGTEAEVKGALRAAGWFPADPLSLKSSLEIAEASVLDRPYNDAPVSNLYLFGRKEDLAFEQPVGTNPRQRHHVRFWRTEEFNAGRPVWVGSAIYDERVGLSRTTGQVTHKTAPDIDTERDKLFADLKQGGDVAEEYTVDDYHQEKTGRNGGGDPWHTDGKLYAALLKPSP